MTKILVVEDEEIQRKNLMAMIKETSINIEILEAESESDALSLIEQNDIDIFFIDISLKQSSGLELAYKIREITQYKLSWIIFVTSIKEHMLSAFKELHCYDYLLKPYKKEEVKELIESLLGNLKVQDKKEEREYIILSSKGISYKIYLDSIYFIEARLRNIIVHTVDGKYELSRTTLKKIKEMIGETKYIMHAHRAYMINLKKIKKIEKQSLNAWEVYFESYNEAAYIGSKYKEEVDKYLYRFRE